ncbi:HAMP domain-containing protein [Kibdelosporangium aridum]|uniref:HAMP domain-containing protein n=1 Tax=Kibdelosporangium aridum TaxID=2030 RepID=UPI0035E60680
MTRGKWRLSTRLRVALTAAAGSAVVLVVGAAWFIGQLQDEADAKVFEIAQQKAHAVAVTLETANDVPGRLPELGSLGPWEVVDKDTGRRVASFPPACTAHPDVPFLAVLAKESPPWRVTLPQTAPGDIAANCYTAGTYPLDRDLQVAQVTINDSEYTVYAGERLDAGTLEPVATARATAWTTVPIGVVLVAVVAWLSVRRALRPVNAIRFEVADITSEGLRRRVPVPRTGDELSLLAETMNDMLTRLDRSTQRQRQFVADSSHELRGPFGDAADTAGSAADLSGSDELAGGVHKVNVRCGTLAKPGIRPDAVGQTGGQARKHATTRRPVGIGGRRGSGSTGHHRRAKLRDSARQSNSSATNASQSA